MSDLNTFQCILCEKCFVYKTSKFDPKSETSKPVIEKLKQHLLLSHKLLISDVYEIPNFIEYLNHWREKLKENKDLKSYCAVIRTNSKPEDVGESEEYFMLCADVLREERELREKLHKKRLQEILEIQQKERLDQSFSRQCLFCKKIFKGNIRALIGHLAVDHNFTFGHPDNLVFVGELLDLIESKLKQSICLYCEKVFKDRDTLREHMRKKHHKQINPHNKEYDKFYVVNYLECGNKQKKDVAADNEEIVDENDDAEDEEWDDWTEEDNNDIICLFCAEDFCDVTLFGDHLLRKHHFDWNAIQCLTFYEKVKIVNYIRKCVESNVCMHCKMEIKDSKDFVRHINDENEISAIPSKELWDLPEHYFPIRDNDHLLSILQDDDEAGNQCDNIQIIAE